MKHIFCLAVWILVCAAVSVSAQDDAAKVPSLQDARTDFDVFDYMYGETGKIDKDLDKKQQAALRADIFMASSDKLMEIAKEENDSRNARRVRLFAFQAQIEAEIEGAEQRLEAFLNELAAREATRCEAEGLRFELFVSDAMKTIDTPEGYDAFKSGLKSWIYRNIDTDIKDFGMYIRADRIGSGMLRVAEVREGDTEQFLAELIAELNEYIQSAECTLSAKDKETAVHEFEQTLELVQFGQFYQKAYETVDSPESFDTFKAELKSWINRKTVNVDDIPSLALLLAEKNGIPAEQIMDELIAFLQSPECTSRYKSRLPDDWQKLLLTAYGSELKLYGRTLDDKDFDWDGLRGKYVLVQFTATWCGPCHAELPGMKEVYAKYHNKGFEIVSLYVFERGVNPVAEIKEHVDNSKLPWIVISETLTEKAGQPKYEESFAISSVPTMLLVDKTGKIIMTNARSKALQTKLAEIFE